MKSQYDIVVVGTGPAGSWAAKCAAERGASVLLLEKDRDIGLPVRCAEGVEAEGLSSLLPKDTRWIAREIHATTFVAPDGSVVRLDVESVGWVLNRKIFDYDLACMASDAGAEVVTRAYVSGLIMENGSVRGLHVEHSGRSVDIGSSVVIGADGVESRVGRWAGLKTATHPDEMACCVQMTLAGIDIDADAVAFCFGKDVAPGGYLWIFPKGPRSANVGLGLPARFASQRRPLAYLEEFVGRRFPGASRVAVVAGGVPLTPPLKKLTADGVMIVGDAAHQVNPLTGGGIVWAMKAADIAGRVAAEAVRKGDTKDKRLSAYTREWMSGGGKRQQRYYALKRAIHAFSDEDLNGIAAGILKMPAKKRTLFEIFRIALAKRPALLLEAAKLFL